MLKRAFGVPADGRARGRKIDPVTFAHCFRNACGGWRAPFLRGDEYGGDIEGPPSDARIALEGEFTPVRREDGTAFALRKYP